MPVSDGLSPDELEEQAVIELPVRESLSVISANLVGPVHAAIAGLAPQEPAAEADAAPDLATEPGAS